ncbi:MAG: hypothetical protein ACRDNZ_01450 [Streptosporangiaceae bacterium]
MRRDAQAFEARAPARHTATKSFLSWPGSPLGSAACALLPAPVAGTHTRQETLGRGGEETGTLLGIAVWL